MMSDYGDDVPEYDGEPWGNQQLSERPADAYVLTSSQAGSYGIKDHRLSLSLHSMDDVERMRQNNVSQSSPACRLSLQ